MKKILPIIALFIIVPILVQASGKLTINSSDLFNFNSGKQAIQNTSKYPKLQGMTNVVPFNVNQSVTAKILTDKPDELTINQFPITAQISSDITLQKDVVNPFIHTQVIIDSEKNHKRLAKSPQFIMYSGKISGEPNSSVNLVYVNNEVFGYIKQNDGTLSSIAPSNGAGDNLHFLAPHVLNLDNSNNEPPTYSCLTDDYVGTSTEQIDLVKHKNDKLQSGSDVLQANIICEGSYDYFELMGEDEDKAVAYMYSVMALTAKIYHEFLNVDIMVTDVLMRTSSTYDPYNADATLANKLQSMPTVWGANTKPRALVVLFADLKDQPANTIVAGISMGGEPYKGSLCSNGRGYCALGINGYYNYPTYRYTWDVNVAAHEMGHNFSAPHTHSCYFAPNMIDTCVTKQTVSISDACIQSGGPIPRPGTIMSYCHVSNSTHSVELIFHPREIPLMRKAAEDCGCLNAKSDKFISLLAPLGDSTFRAGSGNKITVRWTSAHINSVNVYLSTDFGKTWGEPIATNLPANDTIYSFDVPEVNTDSALFMVKDAEDPNVFDTGIDPCSIKVQNIAFTVPKENDGFANNENVTAVWTSSFNDSFKLELTTNGGANWDLVVPSTQNTTYTHNPISENLPNCQFRLTSLTDNTVVLSPVFSIGAPSAKVIYPNGGEYISANTDYVIVWESTNLHECKIDYSTDNGASWRFVNLNKIDASTHKYSWDVPNIDCDSALIRIKSAIDGTIYDESDNVFKLFFARPNSVEEQTVDKHDISIVSIAPNPFSNNAVITIVNPTTQAQVADLVLTDETGRLVETLGKLTLDPDSKFSQEIVLGNLPSGNYFVMLKTATKNYTYSVRIIK